VTDRIALITGVGGATGAALSRRFAQGGYRVAMLARNAERLAELEARIPGARAYPCDVADLDRLGAVVERVDAELGAPHVLVHNAVAATFATIFEAKGCGSRAELSGEHHVLVLSRAEARAGDDRAPTKAAERILAQCLAKDLGPRRIHVGYVSVDAAIDAPWLKATVALPNWQDKSEDDFAQPDAIADEVYHITHQHHSTWSFDHVIRPFTEHWTLN